MTVLIAKDSPFFDKQVAVKNFEFNRNNLDDENGFDDILSKSHFFNVYNHGYAGSVFVYQGIDDKYYIGGYTLRKRHKEAVDAIIQVSAMFDEVYAHTRHVNAVIALKKAGFEWYSRKRKLLRKININGGKK